MTEVTCVRCTNEAPAIEAEIPWPDPLGSAIRSQICKICWSEWEEQAIIVINELSLKLFLPEDRQKLETQLRDFLKLTH